MSIFSSCSQTFQLAYVFLALTYKYKLTTVLRDDEFAAFDREFFQSQKAAEEQIEHQKEREKQDAEFARSLQNDGFAVMNPPSTSGPSAFNRNAGRPQASSSSYTNTPSSSAHNAFDRMSGVRHASSSSAMASNNRENAHSASARKLPPGWNNGASSQRPGFSSVKSEPKLMTPGIKAESSFGSYPTQRAGNTSGMNPFAPVKSEQKYAITGAFQDDSSAASDSDIEIISPSAFRDNGRHPATSSGAFGTQRQLPSFSPEAMTAGDAALRRLEQSATNTALQQAMYGKQQRPSWMHNQSYPALPSGSSMNSSGYPPQ